MAVQTRSLQQVQELSSLPAQEGEEQTEAGDTSGEVGTGSEDRFKLVDPKAYRRGDSVPAGELAESLGGDDVGTTPIIPGQAPQNSFNIDVRFTGTFTASQQAAFTAAAARWEEIIVGDVQILSV
mgnify:CR=1 FL=1